ncbi:Fructoselysine-6-P-deglycase FrlB with duplicated sugar isomerase (SIS) domain [Austwickia chelonae]|uniref:SIS domain-containing protein n=1 Tax=Austwickia chelonae NBRC 105200 TaxID=1184607 RepID=K6VRI3_9MICO|nr:hypothetical protein [Austwickia chelonae]GAB77965.1 hypothetical protein AUCHE_08_02080 [Austwickia chelonae NBRC 105200]SEV93227.1 Fructoselysine-6-P-deglycase FrlB with duplicated sugar isomerase (SIS) domain [Austwickia chelonae]
MSGNPSYLALELADQPDDWAWAGTRAAEIADLLPAPGERVAAIGCGTSLYMAQAYAGLRTRAEAGWTDAFPASEHHLERGYDQAVVICRSGTTTEIVDVVDTLHRLRIPHVALVGTQDTPVARRADKVIDMSRVDEKSVVQTRFATTTLSLLRASLGEDLAEAVADARAVLDETPPHDRLVHAEQFTFLGRGWTVGLAHEAALKLRESARRWTESYPATEYRHGPISIAGPNRVVWALGEVPAGLAEQVTATGAHFEHRDSDPLSELVRVHRLCLAVSTAHGLDPDAPMHLTRSIIL